MHSFSIPRIKPNDANLMREQKQEDGIIQRSGHPGWEANIAGGGMMMSEESKSSNKMTPFSDSHLQMKCEECDKEEKLQLQSQIDHSQDQYNQDSDENGLETVMMKPSESRSSNSSHLALNQVLNETKNDGQPIGRTQKNEFGKLMGADFEGVKIHDNTKAIKMNQALGAKAFTHGRDIYFNRGQFNPNSKKGQHLLAHELTHVVQQSGKKDSQIRAKNNVPTIQAQLYLYHLKNKKEVSDELIQKTEQFKYYKWRGKATDQEALLACQLVLQDLKNDINIPPKKHLAYLWIARERLASKNVRDTVKPLPTKEELEEREKEKTRLFWRKFFFAIPSKVVEDLLIKRAHLQGRRKLFAKEIMASAYKGLWSLDHYYKHFSARNVAGITLKEQKTLKSIVIKLRNNWLENRIRNEKSLEDPWFSPGDIVGIGKMFIKFGIKATLAMVKLAAKAGVKKLSKKASAKLAASRTYWKGKIDNMMKESGLKIRSSSNVPGQLYQVKPGVLKRKRTIMSPEAKRVTKSARSRNKGSWVSTGKLGSGARKIPSKPVVERISKRATTIAKEKLQINNALDEFKKLPKVSGSKTVAKAGKSVAKSGYHDPDIAKKANRLAKDMKYKFPKHGHDQGKPSQYFANHAEIKLAVMNPKARSFAVSNIMCDNCSKQFFRRLAVYRRSTHVVAQPGGIWIFTRDGSLTSLPLKLVK
jgi:hypothetical protein